MQSKLKELSSSLNLTLLTNFKKHNLYSKYFEWYKEGVTKEDVVQIYKKCNVEFYDLEKVSNAKKLLASKNNKKQKIL